MAPAPPRASNQRQVTSHPQSQISMRDLENQRTKLKPPVAMEKRAMPADVRDSLMAEIRNAGGIRALRRTSREQ
ncbi:hypothetical protein OESDEN_10557 [Oesophagostomum dentatum]|uniref:WH2 domain-containing protein n=1 Tax=Oesophagostomum dentatum TaxID=61180 RepID=A0A0B1SXD3_OESDE|nr:hypothetical protein OESDEN_10557 [Oesophagostomum dentatum]